MTDNARRGGTHFKQQDHRGGEVPVLSAAERQMLDDALRAMAGHRPDETSVYIAAAHKSASALQRPRIPRADETAVFLAAAASCDAGAESFGATPAIPPAVAFDDMLATDATGSLSTQGSSFAPQSQDAAPAETPNGMPNEAPNGAAAADSNDDMSASDYGGVGRSAGMMTMLTIVSRVTGFIRTWAMAAAIGMSLLSSSYQVANNLPNMLYELVMGGMLVTAFLPVYMGVRKNQGSEDANEYVGNLLGILLLILGAISMLGTVFSPAFIWTQSFMSGSSGGMDTAVFMFRFFAIQILFYGLGSVFSGVLNAHRDYFWSTFAPVLNNIIVIASFLAYNPVAQINQTLGVIVISAGTTLGVFVQMACQIPALKKHGIKPRVHIDFHDPALRQTVALGIPTLLATACMFVNTSVTNAAALSAEPKTGPSIIAYARLWYTLPYALIAASLSTALYTELSRDVQAGDEDSVRSGISNGLAQMFFFLVPFALYLIAFSEPLNMIYCTGKFDASGVAAVSDYLCFLAVSLPFYGTFVLLQKSFSALLDMKPYGRYSMYATVGQVVFILVAAVLLGGGMRAIALSSLVYYLIINVCSVWWLRRRLGGLQMGTVIHGFVFGLLLGIAGAAAGHGTMQLVTGAFSFIASTTLRMLICVALGGCVSLIVTFGVAAALKLPEARMITSIVHRVSKRQPA